MHNFTLAGTNHRGYIFLFFLLSSFIAPKSVIGQCPNDNNFASAVGSFQCNADALVAAGAGTYVTFPVAAGASYTFRTCGTYVASGNLFDTKLTGYNNSGGAFAFFNDDANAAVLGTNATTAPCTDANSNFRDSYIAWTSTFTGTLRVMVDAVRNSDPNGCNLCTTFNCPGLTSALLTYRQINNLTITSSNAALCPGQSIGLTATPSGGTFTGTGVNSGNSTFTAPGPGTYTITYTLGSCSATQDIVVNTPSVAPTNDLGSAAICPGSPGVVLSVSNGSLGTGAQWFWYSNSCGGTFITSGVSSILVNPTSTTSYFVRAQGTCNTTTCASATITENQLSVAPTSILGNPSICPGGNDTLTVQGGSLGTGAQWVWYSGSCGGVFVGTGPSIVVSPVSSTNYFVRAEGTCNSTSCASLLVTISTPSSPPGSVSVTNSTVCNGVFTTLNVNGGLLGTGANWVWYAGGCDLNGAIGTGTSINVNPSTTTTYFVRAEGTCNNTSCAQSTITVQQLSTTPDSISGITSLCSGGAPTTLYVNGGSLGDGAQWRWYSGSCGGAIVGSGDSIVVNPVSTTTYFVRGEGTCNNTACVQVTVTVNQLSTDPTDISGVSTICNGTPTALTVVGGSLGGGANWQWYSGSCGGTLIGSGNSITISPSSNTDFFVRAEGPCNTTPCAFKAITVQDTSVPAASITAVPAAICLGESTNLSVAGGSLGSSATWQWYTGSCGGANVGTGTTLINVSPTTTTTYFARAEGLCNTTICTPYTLAVNPIPNGSIGGSATICAGTVDTILTFNFSVGTAPFDVTYTDGTNTYSKSGINNGDTVHILINTTTAFSYSQIQDANGCERNSGFLGGATLTFVPVPVITFVAATDVLCNGDSTGTITITGSTGTPPYTYSTDGGSTFLSDNPVTVLTGSYNLAIADALNCTSLYSSNPVIIDEPAVLDHTSVGEDASCASVLDGRITITATGGVIPYSYSLNGGPLQSGNVFSGLASGTYTVQVVDFNGCSDTSHVLIDTIYAVQGSIDTLINVSCFGRVDGSVTVELTGGIPPYSYSLNGGSFGAVSTFVPLSSGNYVVGLRDSKGCSDFLNVVITQPDLMLVSVDSIHDILCNGGNTGGIFITVNGGNGGNSFLWSNGDTTEDITGLPAGTYNVAITDSKGCATAAGATISQPLPLFVSLASFDNLRCFNDSSGAIDITVNGGVPQYTFAWSNGSSMEDVSHLSSDTYSVTVSDENGCVDSLSQLIDEPDQLVSTITPTGILCAGGGGGSVDLDVIGGIPGYSYLWSNGTTTQDLVNVTGGNYSVIIYDANGCSATNFATVAQPAAISLSTVVTNVLCRDSLNGIIDLSVAGGTGAYSFLWNNNDTTEDLTNVAAGNYSVIVTDANACSASASATVTQPAGLILNSTLTDGGCAGSNNGSIDITIQGGTFPYSFLWTNNATTEDINGLAAGNYSVTVTDTNSCKLTRSFIVTGSSSISSFVTGTNVTCNGSKNGRASLTIDSGGTAPYTILWSTFQNTGTIDSLNGGIYYVIITDANGCESRDSVIITEPTPITLTTAVTNVSCFDSLTGRIDLTVSGGAGGNTFLWSNNGTAEDIVNLAAGSYSVVVSDINTCTASASAEVSQPSELLITEDVVHPKCSGNNNGSVSLSVFGGVPVYTFLWSDGSTNPSVQNLPAGNISVTVTDANSCSVTGSYTIMASFGLISSTVTATNIVCDGNSTGTASIDSISGGSEPYTFLWSNFQVTRNISGLSGGTYYVIITDANGCTARDSAIVLEPSPFIISDSMTNISCFDQNDGSIYLSVSGSNPPYSYLWNNNDTTQNRAGLSDGTYSVVVTDLNGCTASASVTIIRPSDITLNFVIHSPLCYQDQNGSIDLIPSGGVPNYSFNWTNAAVTEDIFGIGAGPYEVTVTDVNGCTEEDSIFVTEPGAFYLSQDVKDITCFGYSDGEVDMTAYGGTLPYSFVWQDSVSTEDRWDLPGGVYTVFVSDANGCQAVWSDSVVEPQLLTVDIDATAVSCFGGSNGSVTAIPSGGTQPYSYLWSDFSIDPTHSGISSGYYALVLTDFNGCLTYDSITVPQPDEIQIVGQITDATCNGFNTGAIDIQVSGGTPAYTYAWSGGSVTEDLTNIVANTYTVTVTDANSCNKSEEFIVKDSPGFFASVSSGNPVCNGGNSGFILIDATGGTSPYTYNWSTPTPHSSMAANLEAGTYSVTVSDAKNCRVSASTILLDPLPIEVTANPQGANCFNTTGGVTASVTGGTQPYTYLLNGVTQGSEVFAGIPPGDHLLLVMDVNGCQGKVPFTVPAASEIEIDLGATQQVILTGMQTQLIATPVNGPPIVSYMWSPDSLFDFSGCDPANCSTPLVAPRTTTLFTVTAMNSDSCYSSDTITIYVNNEVSKFIPTAFTPNGDGLNDRFEFDILGATKIEVSIFNRWGQRVFYNPDQKNGTNGGNGWDGTIDGKPAPHDTYVYQINATYWDEATQKTAGTVTLMK